jgi:hypothetical protein
MRINSQISYSFHFRGILTMKSFGTWFSVVALTLFLAPSVYADQAPKQTYILGQPIAVTVEEPVAVEEPVTVEGTVDAILEEPIEVYGTVTVDNTAASGGDLIELFSTAAFTGSGSCSSAEHPFYRNLPSGTANEFTIPAGQQLIVTRVIMTINGVASLPANFIVNRRAEQFVANTAFSWQVPADTYNNGASVVDLTPGFASTVPLCVLLPSGGANRIFLYGYLVDL